MQEIFKQITFTAEDHKYKIGDRVFPISSTGWVHQFVNPFDAELHATNTANKRSLELMRDVSVQEILDERSASGKESANEIGTPFHKCMELMLINKNRESYKDDSFYKDIGITQDNINPKLLKILPRSSKFYDEYIIGKRLTPLQSELILGSEKFLVAGQIDQVMQTEDQIERSDETIVYCDLRDWKSSKKIEKNGYNKFMKQEFSKYPDANYYHYSLQLSLYKYILEYETGDNIVESENLNTGKSRELEKHPKYVVENMYVGHFSYLNSEYTVIPMIDMTKEIDEHFSKNGDLF